MEIFQTAFRPQHIRSNEQVRVVILPYWIKQVLQRNKLDYIDVLNFDKLRKVLSIEDFAQFLSCNMALGYNPLDKIFGDSYIDLNWYNSPNIQELHNVILPLSQADTTRDAVLNRLMQADFKMPENLSETPLYRFQTLNDQTLMVFIERGLLNAFEHRDFAKAMVSDHLKALYSLLPISDVSKYYRVFEHYLDLL